MLPSGPFGRDSRWPPEGLAPRRDRSNLMICHLVWIFHWSTNDNPPIAATPLNVQGLFTSLNLVKIKMRATLYCLFVILFQALQHVPLGEAGGTSLPEIWKHIRADKSYHLLFKLKIRDTPEVSNMQFCVTKSKNSQLNSIEL